MKEIVERYAPDAVMISKNIYRISSNGKKANITFSDYELGHCNLEELALARHKLALETLSNI